VPGNDFQEDLLHNLARNWARLTSFWFLVSSSLPVLKMNVTLAFVVMGILL